MKIEADKKPKDDKEYTIADVKAFLAKLELLNVPDNARLKCRATLKSYLYELSVDTDDLRPPGVGEPGHEKWPGGLR